MEKKCYQQLEQINNDNNNKKTKSRVSQLTWPIKSIVAKKNDTQLMEVRQVTTPFHLISIQSGLKQIIPHLGKIIKDPKSDEKNWANIDTQNTFFKWNNNNRSWKKRILHLELMKLLVINLTIPSAKTGKLIYLNKNNLNLTPELWIAKTHNENASQ